MRISYNGDMLKPRLWFHKDKELVKIKLNVDTLDVIISGSNFREKTTLEELLNDRVHKEIERAYPHTRHESTLLKYHLLLSRLMGCMVSSEIYEIMDIPTKYANDPALLEWFNFINGATENDKLENGNFNIQEYATDTWNDKLLSYRDTRSTVYMKGYKTVASNIGVAVYQDSTAVNVKIYAPQAETERVGDNETFMTYFFNDEFSEYRGTILELEVQNIYTYFAMKEVIECCYPFLELEMYKLYTSLAERSDTVGLRR